VHRSARSVMHARQLDWLFPMPHMCLVCVSRVCEEKEETTPGQANSVAQLAALQFVGLAAPPPMRGGGEETEGGEETSMGTRLEEAEEAADLMRQVRRLISGSQPPQCTR
jgi:hypothetical protein